MDGGARGAGAAKTGELTAGEADAIVAEAARTYFAGCRARIRPFVDRTFSIRGSLGLHRRALGWDVLRAPANALLSVPQIALRLGGLAARSAGMRRMAGWLERRHLLLETAVARELRWRIVTELLRQPLSDRGREAREDALAEAILGHPRMQALVADAAATVDARRDDPGFRARLDLALTEYTGNRAAASEITTALLAISTGAVAFQKATPGAVALGPVIAGTLAQQAAIASFPLGAGAGGLWYGLFPAKASPMLIVGATGSLIGLAAILTAFAGVVADPVQRGMGLHERRLHALVDSVERAFVAGDGAGYVAYDLYVARLMDLSDVLIGIARALRG